ncbi:MULTISPECIES: hypothetical protein [Archaeoglobus]|jgi:hypothetical protein|uniref:Uncharacterized protein AF_1457 n=3 Tax=Archaeoglobus fulgidus TaxID=2234 RepID=Y1457_ARCFU|nr:MULTISPECIES: hypothetical protein [Archaeoglobus]O28815.1 RecName: Full=Uncharacterized protein AF_1457 [Archaeoglobus fulgidus DSM 4304]AAB89792.1 predicted coding region AF_1457 [Archaeoglobus fulgidus DSM 4304]AIG98333.1 hypothetical protein AFULGI_00015700 [Archaeoglobus fulgidus DSM 8774]KUJ94423.1 MAG: hypothetical protein XD40_0359 [Archaeoglobus fulgidus]KUK07383.1 MAG: Uncharacterized protein XD48_0379 [Archaeoglobus fulgidus]MDI3496670.1 hypothetical protein [Archaeoglobus sp.]
MDARDIVLSVISVFSAAALVYRWLSLYDRVDMTVIFFATLLIASLTLLLISIELRMQRIMDEFKSVKRTIAVNSDDLEGRIERLFIEKVRDLEDKLESIERRMYR